MAQSLVRWPDGARPDQSTLHAFNEIECDADPQHVWEWLVRATRWPEWYGNAKRVEIEGGGDDLGLGVDFRWTTFGIRVHTTICEWEPPHRLAWGGKALGGTGHHAWVIEPSRIVTEETQRGFVPWVASWYIRPGLLRWHQRWLEGLVRRAADGPPC
jgi:hypothetical protein